jgi:hypothetical protein
VKMMVESDIDLVAREMRAKGNAPAAKPKKK